LSQYPVPKVGLEFKLNEVGFVPTMGALHAGHAALIRAATSRSEKVIVSVFVNPLQFNDPDDLKRYPRTPDYDREIATAAGASEVWFPTYEEIYPSNPIRIEAGPVGALFEGASRPSAACLQ
jgi:pantoate--beta-alanine ligase